VTDAPTVCIVGGGILGVSLAYRLAQRGAAVTLLERGDSLGGLAGSIDLGGHRVDRFYHVILPSDSRMIETAEELGLGGALRFSPTGVGFLIDGQLHPMNGVGDFLRFRPLSPPQRLRLAWFIAQCQVRGSVESLDDVPLLDWLRRHCGSAVVERIWRPLLESRFDGRPEGLPATYLWARTRRMSSARKGRGGGEQMGCLEGGHQTLIDAMAAATIDRGGQLETGAAVERLLIGDDGGIDGVVVGGAERRFDVTILAVQPPVLRTLLPPSHDSLLADYAARYLGVCCVVLEMRRSVMPFYSINICDPTPVTTVVETSHVVGTEHTGGHRLLYVPRYVDQDSRDLHDDEEAVCERYVSFLERALPGFSRDDVVASTVQRARYVEPVHELGAGRRIPPVFGVVPRLALASSAQVYPWLLNGESVMRMADGVVAGVADRLGLDGPARVLAPPVGVPA
jgi:protoporphyrinogen oxidase